MSRVIERHSLMRVDEIGNSWNLLAIKMKARNVAGRGGRRTRVVTPELSYVQGGRGRKAKSQDNRRDEQKQKNIGMHHHP